MTLAAIRVAAFIISATVTLCLYLPISTTLLSATRFFMICVPSTNVMFSAFTFSMVIVPVESMLRRQWALFSFGMQRLTQSGTQPSCPIGAK